MQVVGQCSPPMVELGDPAPSRSACLDDDRALALVDGQLSPRAREEIEAHLDVCASCRRFVSELAKESLFERPHEAPTDLERTGYAPGRPQLLDVAFTVRDLAATRVGVPDPSTDSPGASTDPPRPSPVHTHMPGASGDPPAAPAPSRPRVEAPRSGPLEAPLASNAPPASAGLSRAHVAVLVVALALALLTGLAALISVVSLGYTLLVP